MISQLLHRDVGSDLDVPEESEVGIGGDPVVRLRDGLDLLMVRRDAAPDQAEGRGEPVVHVDLDRKAFPFHQMSRGVEPGRAGADDRDPQRGCLRACLCHSDTSVMVKVSSLWFCTRYNYPRAGEDGVTSAGRGKKGTA